MVKVSIITPAFQVEKEMYLRSQESVVRQLNKDFEWIIVSDGSGNHQFYNDKYGDVFPVDVELDRNYGPSVARNVGFQISSGDIITYLDMGDELSPDRVENLISLYDKYHMDLIFSAYNIVNPDGSGGTFDHFSWIGQSSRFPTAVEYVRLLQYQNIAIPLGVAHTRRPFIEVGGFQRGIVCGEDGILWRRMASKIEPTKILFSNDVAGVYHINETGQSRTQRRFEMGGFAFDGSRNDNGRYLDEEWFKTFSSKGLYDETLER